MGNENEKTNEKEKWAEEKQKTQEKIESGSASLIIDEMQKKGIDISEHKEKIENIINNAIGMALISLLL